MPSPTAAQVAAAREIVARIVSADAIAGRRSGEARQAHWRAIMATALAEWEAAVRAETWEAAAKIADEHAESDMKWLAEDLKELGIEGEHDSATSGCSCDTACAAANAAWSIAAALREVARG